MAVLTTFKSNILSSNKYFSDFQAIQYKDLKSDLAGVLSQMVELRKENTRLQSEIHSLKEKVITLENYNIGVESEQVVSQVLEETTEREKYWFNLIIYGISETISATIPQRISHDRSSITV